jgi:hypothetical protein
MTSALAVIATVSMLIVFGVVLWFLIGTGLFPWWIAVGPVVVFGLVAAGLVKAKTRPHS